MSLKKHSLYELVLSWAQVSMPCCVTAECLRKIIEKSVMSESFVFCLETQSLTQFSIACSWSHWTNICFITWIGLVSSMQLLAGIQPCCVVLQLHVLKLLRKQFVFCPVTLNPWLDFRWFALESRFSICAGIRIWELSWDCNRLSTFEWCSMVLAWIKAWKK